MKKLNYLLIFALFITLGIKAFAENYDSPNSSQVINKKYAFIDYMADKYHFDKNYLTNVIFSANFLPEVIQKKTYQKQRDTWKFYKEIFVTNDRGQDGCYYWHRHQQALNFAKTKYGVDPSIIIAIVGIETDYGKKQGQINILDSLVTLAFNYHAQTDFFQKELVEYLLFTREYKLDPRFPRGSYSGAIGYPQFMPSSYRYLAVSYHNKNKKPDLFNDTDDVVVSVANFLEKSGWQANGKTIMPAKVSGDKYKQILNNDMKIKFTVATLKQYDIKPATPLPANTYVNFVRLKNKTGYENWLVLPNFYVITHYNNSVEYAMAVSQLANKIRQNCVPKTCRENKSKSKKMYKTEYICKKVKVKPEKGIRFTIEH